jgi:CRISPR-associated endonuclease/helicase Cas3
VRFQALRVFGLARKVLILDEVHAYDAFVSQELQRLIEWQATAGGSCVLLSATLPIEVRRRLINAFRGAIRLSTVAVAETGYPLATLVSADGFKVTTAKRRPSRARSLPVRLLQDPEDALDIVSKQAARGRAAAYIRNTVDDAIETHAKLQERGIDAILFHARMALIDRFRAEGEVLRLFGKRSGTQDRSGKVVIATQVIEQSLDLGWGRCRRPRCVS